jgi:hypothetical protein
VTVFLLLQKDSKFTEIADRTTQANGKFSRQFKIMISFNNVASSQSTTKNKEFQILHHVLISIGIAFFVDILLMFQPHTKLKFLCYM